MGRLDLFVAIFLMISLEMMGGVEGKAAPGPQPAPAPGPWWKPLPCYHLEWIKKIEWICGPYFQ